MSTATFGIETVSITRPDTYERLEKRYQGDALVYQYLCELFPEVFPFDKDGWDRYAYGQLMNLAYRKKDYAGARKYATLSQSHSFKARCTKTKLSFYLHVLYKDIKAVFK